MAKHMGLGRTVQSLHGQFLRAARCFGAALCLSAAAAAQSTVTYIPALVTVAGNGTAGDTGDNGLATAAEFKGPEAGVFDKGGNLYIADATAYVVRKVTVGTGIITLVAGIEGTEGAGCANGTAATMCPLDDPYGVAVDPAGNVYISDPNYNVIRVVNTSGNISIFAGIPAATAGATGTASGDGGAATAANLYFPTDLMMDAAGLNLYFADGKNAAIRKVNLATGVISLVAGVEGKTCATTTAACGDGGLATAANLSNSVYGLAFDATGNLYIADTRNYRIRKVTTSTGIISTVAGSGTVGTLVTPYVGPANGDWGPALSANLIFPQRVIVDSAGAIYIADSNDNEIRRVDPATGIITNYVGTGTTPTAFVANGPSTQISNPIGVFFDNSGNLYIAERGETVIRKVVSNTQFPLTAVASTSSAQSIYALTYAADTFTSAGVTSGFKDFTAGKISGCSLTAATASHTTCTLPVTFAPQLPGLRSAPVAITDSTTSYVIGVTGFGSSATTAIYPSNISTVAGNGTGGYTGDNGVATSATLDAPAGVVLDNAGNVYFADRANNAVRRITAGTNTITTIAGTGVAGYTGDGAAATSAQLTGPAAVAVDAAGNVFIADTGNSAVRRVDAGTGKISTYAGTGVSAFAGDGGLATTAELSKPAGVVVDMSGNVYIADTGNNRLREVVSGIISTVAGTGVAGETGDGAAATSAELNGPTGLALGPDLSIVIADTANNVVRRYVPSTGIISKLAGTGTSGYTGDGGAPASATLASPSGIAVDAAGDIYIADSGNNAARLVYGNSITTVAGTGTAGYLGDGGLSNVAQLKGPAGVAVNMAGALLISDTGNDVLRSVNAAQPSITFPQEPLNTTSNAQTELLLNDGNQTLTLTALTIPAGFVQKASGGTDCTSSTSLAPGAGCLISLTFTPTSATTTAGSVSITDNALSSSSSKQTILLSGTGYVVPTSLALSGIPSTVVAGTAQSLTVKPMASGSTIPSFTGTLHFTSTDPLAVLPADYTYTSADAGSHTFSVTLETAGSECITVADAAYSLTAQVCSTVTAAAAATVTVAAGNNQTTQINSAFPAALQASVADAYGNPVSGVTVTFTPVPNAGASASFMSATAVTSSSGSVTSSTVTANGTVGSYTVNATAPGAGKAAVFSLANSALSVPAVTLSTGASATAVYGQSVTLTAMVSSTSATQPTGTVAFYDTPSGSTRAQVSTTQTLAPPSEIVSVADPVLAVGSHTLSANYSGDTNYSASQANAAFTVIQATVTLAGPATQPVAVPAGQTSTIVVSVNGVTTAGAASPAGTLTYTIGSQSAQTTTIANSQATLAIPNTLAAGKYTIALSYPGDTNYQAATGTVTITASQQSQTITFAAPAPQTYGNAALTLAAASTSGLAVTFQVISGPAILSGTSLKFQAAGTVVVEADQAGNLAYLAAMPVQQTIIVAKAPTQTLLSVASNPSVLNQPAAFTATLVLTGTSFAVAPTGTVTFFNGSTTLGSSNVTLVGTSYVATYSTSSLPSGSSSITAAYSGDGNYLMSTSAPLVQTVSTPTFSIAANPTALTIVNGQSGMVTLTLKSINTYAGTLSFSCDPLPRQSYCISATPTLSLTSNGTATEILTIQTTPTAGLFGEVLRNRTSALAMVPAALLLLPLALAWNRRRSTAKLFIMAILLMFGFTALSGCGSTASTQVLPGGTPTGVTNVVIFATDGTTTQSTGIAVTIQ